MTRKKPKKEVRKKSTSSNVESLFIRISEPLNIKKQILESSKDLLVLSKNMEKIKQIRKNKNLAVEKIKSDINEVKNLVNKLKRKFPASAVSSMKSLDSIKEDKIQSTDISITEIPKENKKPQKELTEMEKLELEIEQIEKKLSSL